MRAVMKELEQPISSEHLPVVIIALTFLLNTTFYRRSRNEKKHNPPAICFYQRHLF